MSVQVAKKLFTVEEYYKMAEAGIFDEDDRVELIHGEIIEMSPIGSPHMACVNRLTSLLKHLPAEAGILSIQNPVGIDDFSEPEPDVAVLKFRKDFYQEHKPMPKDVLLVIEVADTSVERDRKVKIPLYAFAGIPEAWLVDLHQKSITVFKHPKDGGYLQSIEYQLGGTIQCSTVERLSVAVSDVIWTK